jgi:hypothetical protein
MILPIDVISDVICPCASSSASSGRRAILHIISGKITLAGAQQTNAFLAAFGRRLDNHLLLFWWFLDTTLQEFAVLVTDVDPWPI